LVDEQIQETKNIFLKKKMDDEIYVFVCLDPNSQINSNLWLEK
jgi:hypothetical protein